MSNFDSNILISSDFGDYTRSYLSGSQLISYYIHDDSNQDIEIASGMADTIAHSGSYESYIRNIFNDLDPLISVDFSEVYNSDEAILRIYSISDFSRWDQSTVGQVSMQSEYWDILWRGSNSDTDFNRNSIIHEIGHSLGLSHPNEDPTNPLWDTDITVMSYNKSQEGWNTSFSDNDVYALQLIWGTEENEIINNDNNLFNNNPLSDNIAPLVDDYSQDSNTTGLINTGESLSGILETLGDRDWFEFNLTAGQILQLQLDGYSSNSKLCPCFSCSQKRENNNLNNSGKFQSDDKNLFLNSSLKDPYLRLYDAQEQLLLFDDDSGSGLNSFLNFSATYTGTYYASVGSYADNFNGDYILNLSLDDFVNDSSTKGTLNYGEILEGDLEVIGDKDWFSFETVTGDELQIDLQGITLNDSYLNLYDLDGNLVDFNDDISSVKFDSRINFSSQYSGNYFVSVESFKNRYKGKYSLSLQLSTSNSSNVSQNISNSINSNPNQITSDIEALAYIASHEDLISYFGNNAAGAIKHYDDFGKTEERTITFDASQYLANYTDLTDFFSSTNGYTTSESITIGAIRHFIEYGHGEGRNFSNLFKNNNNYLDPFEFKNYLGDTF